MAGTNDNYFVLESGPDAWHAPPTLLPEALGERFIIVSLLMMRKLTHPTVWQSARHLMLQIGRVRKPELRMLSGMFLA